MAHTIHVQAKSDHVASLARGTPLSAVEELVWNALDADAREVRVDLVQNALGGIDAVRVVDDGTGIDVPNAEDTFGSLGGSWKKEKGRTSAFRRRLHGRHGRGRFRAFAIGSHVEWRTTFRDSVGLLVSNSIVGDVSTPDVFEVDDLPTGTTTGTEVEITCVRANATALEDAGAVVSALAAKFALYLKAYPDVHVYFCGIPVTPVIVQKAVTDYKVQLESGAEAKLEVIEWRRRFAGAGRIAFCGGDGFSLHEVPAGVRPGNAFSFTAYLVSPRFTALAAENALVMDELNAEVRAYLDAARRTLRVHFRVRAAEADSSRVLAWIAEGSYPFAKEDASPAREKFDEAVRDMRAHLDGFDAYPASERKYLFGLLGRALGG